ncbi:MAG: hypothetical protein JNK89_03065 [Saprospiraceae bacterium]|nr:hypothetical protein [Saprospiraceae bacterium]
MIYLLALALLLPDLAGAQRQETLANSAKVKGGFGSLYFTFSQADGRSGGGAGLGGAFVIDDFFIGGYFQGENFGTRRYSNRNYIQALSSGGFWLGYAIPSHKMLHVYTALKLGWGAAALRRDDNDPYDGDDITDGVLVLAPEIGAELNVLRWLRIALTGGFRLVGGLDTLPGYQTRDFNSPTLGLTFRMGGFGYR